MSQIVYRSQAVIGRWLDEQRLFVWTRRCVLALAALFLGAGALVAVTIPFHVWDALSYGSWSRRIADTGNLHFPGIGALEYQRPFYYVLQGWIWRIVGFDERTGRLLAFAFAVLLAVCVVKLARVTGRTAWVAPLAILLLLLLNDLLTQGLSGQNDVPVAALVAATGVLVWRPRPGPAGIVLIALAAAAAALTKPTALLALAGLGAAQLAGPTGELRLRLLRRTLPLAAGSALALVWDEAQAHRLGLSLPAFLKAGTSGGYYGALSDSVRRQVGLDLDWLGPSLRLLLVFALLYGLARAVGWAHRSSVLAALPCAAFLSWLGPWIGGREVKLAVGPFAGTRELVAFLVLVGLLAFAAAAPEETVPTRTTIVRLLLWSLPPTAVWLLYLPYGSRYLSPAWPGLIVLCAVVTVPAVAGAARRAVLVPAAGFAVLIALAAANFQQVDDLGNSGWKQFRAAGISGWFDQNRMRNIVMGVFTEELDVTRKQLAARPGPILSSDGKLKFYFPGVATRAYPRRCADLRSYSVFVLLLDPTSVDFMRRYVGASGNPAWWNACFDPQLTLVEQRPLEFAVFAVGDHDGDVEAVFGRVPTHAAAAVLLGRVEVLGFKSATIERDGERDFEVVVSGLQASQRSDFDAEARRAGFHVRFERS